MMKTNILATATSLSDRDLLERLDILARAERETSAELVAHLAALDARSSLYAAHGYGSLFGYCTQALRLSEDAACARIEAARACRRFPAVLELLASGEMSLTTVRLLGRHLTPDNHEAVLARARGRSRREIEALVAELAPRPDAPSSVRKLPTAAASVVSAPSSPTTVDSIVVASEPAPAVIAPAAPPRSRPIVQATSPARYRVQFTVGPETHDKLRRLQTLLRREIPEGDPAAIFDRAMSVLLEKVERTKLGRTARPGSGRPRPAGPIRPGTDDEIRSVRGWRCRRCSRYLPVPVRWAVWERDGSQCAFVSHTGRRCTERTFLEWHHLECYARGGPPTVENISLRCRRHNQYEAELVFGPRASSRSMRPIRTNAAVPDRAPAPPAP